MSIQIFDSNGKPMRMNRRNFLRVTAGLGGAAFLSACAAPAAAPSAPAAPSGDAPAAATEAPAAAAPATGAVALNVLNENWGDIYNGLMTEMCGRTIRARPRSSHSGATWATRCV